MPGRSQRELDINKGDALTPRVVIRDLAAELHLVDKKLRAWVTATVMQARKVHSSLWSQSSYLT